MVVVLSALRVLDPPLQIDTQEVGSQSAPASSLLRIFGLRGSTEHAGVEDLLRHSFSLPLRIH